MASFNKKTARQRRGKRTHCRIQAGKRLSLQVNRTGQHIYAAVVRYTDTGSEVVASASTLDKALRGALQGTKTERAKHVGTAVAERAIKAGVKQVAFDRRGFKFHGRVKALADAAREAGLDF